jgi:hypothetical protein
MALIECKECHREIHEHADPCPQCGVKEPGVSSEEKALREKIAAARSIEEGSVREFNYLSRGFLGPWLNRKEIDRHVEQANMYQRRVEELEAELFQLQESNRKKRKESC